MCVLSKYRSRIILLLLLTMVRISLLKLYENIFCEINDRKDNIEIKTWHGLNNRGF